MVSKKMKAALLFERDKSEIKPGEPVTDLRVVETDVPEIGENDLLVKVRACSVCPTDYRKYMTGNHGVLRWPFNPGHEWTGDIVEVGPTVTKFKVGQRIKGAGFTGYAEYARIEGKLRMHPRRGAIPPFASIFELPSNVDYESGSISMPLAECMFSVLYVLNVKMYDNVVVIGAGPMGAMHIMTAHAAGATVFVSELLEHRLKLAKDLGADYVVNPNDEDPVEFVKDRTGGQGADSVVCSIAHPRVIEQGLRMAKPRGIVNIFGGATADTKLDFNPNLIHYGSRILTASQGQGGRYDLNWKALKMISDGKAPVKKLVTGRYPLDQALEAVKHVGSKKGMKAIIYPYPEDIPQATRP